MPEGRADGMAESVLRLDGVSLTYVAGPPWDRRRTDAVRDVDLEIAAGETVGLVGESGSGKTTLGRLALGLLRASGGEVRFEGKTLGPGARWPPGRRAVVLQHPEWALNPRLRVAVSVAEPLVVQARLTAARRRDALVRMLELVGLEPGLARRYPHELSGGQRQRVAIARALITEPRFVVFDEAVNALDVSIQTQVLNLIKDLQREQGFAALFISHDLAATRYVAHRIAVMYAGGFVEVGPSRLFHAGSRHPYSRALGANGPDDAERFRLRGTGDDVSATGCPLALRCPWSLERCRDERPVTRVLGDGLSACHRAEELRAA